LGGGGAGAASGAAASGRVEAIAQGGPTHWRQCFVELKGFVLGYYGNSLLDPASKLLHGRNLLGKCELSHVRALRRFARADEDPRVLYQVEHCGASHKAMLCLLHVKVTTPDALLRFDSEAECARWAKELARTLDQWKLEVKAMRKFDRGQLAKSTAMKEYHEMAQRGLISKKDLKAAFAQQVSSDIEYVQQHVAIVGEDKYDRRVICDECREVNFLLQCAEDGAFWCSDCGTELFLEAGSQVGGAGKGKGKVGGGVVELLPSALVAPLPLGGDKLPGSAAYPVSAQLLDGSTLTLSEGELVGRPRFDAKTGTRQYYFSFRCQYEDKNNKRNQRFWSIDFPYPSFKFLRESLRKDLDGRGSKMQLPPFPADSGSKVADAKDQARRRLQDLNAFMEQLIAQAQREPQLFRSPPMRFFFNLHHNIRCAPLTLAELDDLKPSFAQLEQAERQGGRAPSKDVMELYKAITQLFPRLEASADEENVFSTTDAQIVFLSNQDKAEIFKVAQDLLLALEGFESKFKLR
jgi:hypothetical protein